MEPNSHQSETPSCPNYLTRDNRLYCDGTVFALVDKGDLYLKSDAANEGAFEAKGLGKFEFTGNDGKIAAMNYRRAPLDVHDDPDAMREWPRTHPGDRVCGIKP